MVDLFKPPLSQNSPPELFPKFNHLQPPVGCAVNSPLQTNNTFNNLLLGDQTNPVWLLPYLLWIAKDGNSDWGIAFNHTEKNQLVFGPDPGKIPAQFYFNPPKIKLFAFTSQNWTNVEAKLVSSDKLSAVTELSCGTGKIVVPMAYGMAFVTAIYQDLEVVVNSQVGFQDFRKVGIVNNNRTAKYSVKLFNQLTWSIYVSGDPTVELRLAGPNHIVGNRTQNCVVQICKGDSPAYDDACGRYPMGVTLSGNVNDRNGTYSFGYKMQGESSSGSGLVWCLPHHQVMLNESIQKKDTGLTLDSPTKGVMRAYATDTLVMDVHDLPSDIAFDPWTSVSGYKYDPGNFTESVRGLIGAAAAKEAQHDIGAKCNVDSMYFGGKELDKYAHLAYVTNFVLRDSELTNKILPQIKQAIEKYAKNQQQNPLRYDQVWKGLVSCAPPDQDFGNSNYNDHHFHYGYHIHAIALVARIDPGWLAENNNLIMDYALTLIRDYANPSSEDPYFPQSRNFDWFHGHSFAHGIFPSGDGKNEESSSEDYHSVRALKLFGRVIGNSEMEARADLMLAIMKTSLNMYMLYSSDNQIQPPQFIGNKVSGILFENKIDFSTFFGRGTVGDEFIHGIHMIPITPISSYIRGPNYVKEEWDAKLGGIVDQIPDGWRGILKLNAGLFDPKYSWDWFSGPDFEDRFIDEGMTRTWSLAYLAGIGASQ